MTTQPKETPQFTYRASMFHICPNCGNPIQIGDLISWKLTGQDPYKVNCYMPVHEECL